MRRKKLANKIVSILMAGMMVASTPMSTLATDVILSEDDSVQMQDIVEESVAEESAPDEDISAGDENDSDEEFSDEEIVAEDADQENGGGQ